MTAERAEHLRISLCVRNAGLDAFDLLSAEASGCPLVLGPGKAGADGAFQLGDWSTRGRSPGSSGSSHWR